MFNLTDNEIRLILNHINCQIEKYDERNKSNIKNYLDRREWPEVVDIDLSLLEFYKQSKKILKESLA